MVGVFVGVLVGVFVAEGVLVGLGLDALVVSAMSSIEKPVSLIESSLENQKVTHTCDEPSRVLGKFEQAKLLRSIASWYQALL